MTIFVYQHGQHCMTINLKDQGLGSQLSPRLKFRKLLFSLTSSLSFDVRLTKY